MFHTDGMIESCLLLLPSCTASPYNFGNVIKIKTLALISPTGDTRLSWCLIATEF